jgi:hypothetical protein
MVIVYTIAVFLAAALLFGVQPMVAKSLLPDFGGGSSVWTTCMLFYQTMLIAGYLYAHLLLTRVPRTAQMVIHTTLIAAAFVVGWLFDSPAPPPGASEFPVPWLLGQLFLVSGLPYFAISSAGPLLQGWFARTGHRRAHDPYFLYAASNAGSFVGLLAYPFVLEPMLGLDRQRALWLALFAAFGVLAVVCVRLTRRSAPGGDTAGSGLEPEKIPWKRRLWWVFLAFVPSTTLLGVTMHITTDVASFPLFWVIPLGLYLLTMIAAFSGRAASIVRSGARPMVLALILALVLMVAWVGYEHMVPLWATLGVQFAVLVSVGLYGHARLALDRPRAANLTEFYLLMSIGGALGGLFNGVVAPLVFDEAYEYHIAIVCALLMLPGATRAVGEVRWKFWARRLRLPALSLLFLLAAMMSTGVIGDPVVRLMIWLIPPGVLVYMGWKDRVASTGAFIFPLLSVLVAARLDDAIIHRERTFYGIYKVERMQEGSLVVHSIVHGTTMHGMQYYKHPVLSRQPLGYYHPDGPCGGIMRVVHGMNPQGANLCIVGLGGGAMVTHGRAVDQIVFMEIDPAVVRIARDKDYFTYLKDAESEVSVRLGDGRLLLERSEEAGEDPFDAIYIDAFTSDAIPTHLLTKEAIDQYFRRLGPDGMVVLHISNRHLDLYPLIHELALLEGCYALLRNDTPDDTVRMTEVHFPSTWAVLTKSRRAGNLLIAEGFGQFEPAWTVRPWTDQYSNLLSVLSRE